MYDRIQWENLDPPEDFLWIFLAQKNVGPHLEAAASMPGLVKNHRSSRSYSRELQGVNESGVASE